jgi:RHS repeat-associated protein
VSYLYNADGQICAVEWTYNGMTVMTGYIYDADGQRVAVGAISAWSCDPATNGFTTQSDYVRDQAGQPLSEFGPDDNGNITLEDTNIWANGVLVATDDSTETHFYLTDWLGTRRVQTSYQGAVEQTCSSLPFGDSDSCGSGILYTGKEADSRSGNDYSVARYYASAVSRWLTPDPSGLTYADPTNPQSMNLYSYVEGNPLVFIDPSGLWLVLNCAADTESNTESDTAGMHIVQVHADLGKCSVTDDGGGQYNGFISQVPQGQTHFQLQAMNLAPNNGTTCPSVLFKLTGIAPGQAPGTTAISRTPRAGIPNGGVAIKPANFGVGGINSGNRSTFLGMTFTANWGTATPSGIPSGIPTQGSFFPVDVIGPASVRNSPGNALDVYNYPSFKQALRSTRTVKVTTHIPANNAGVKCPQ